MKKKSLTSQPTPIATRPGLGRFYYICGKKKKPMNDFLQYISINPEIRFGKPCIKDTRIAVVDILQWLASGMSISEILVDFPSLKEEHIRAALSFAAHREMLTKLVAA